MKIVLLNLLDSMMSGAAAFIFCNSLDLLRLIGSSKPLFSKRDVYKRQETHDIFSDKVQICRPVFLEKL